MNSQLCHSTTRFIIAIERNGAPTFFGSTARFEFPDFTPPIQAAASTLKLAPKPVQRKGILQKNNRCTPCRSFAPPRLTPIFNPSNKSDSRIFRASPPPFSFRMRRFRFSLRNRRVSPHQKRGRERAPKIPVCLYFLLKNFSRSALDTTVTELRLIAAAAIIGESAGPPKIFSTPAAIGIPITL